MEIKFDTMEIPALQPVVRQVQNLEQTQEVRISDGMPDIGRIVGAWGQILLRGKEWHTGHLGVSGGVMVWILYISEDGSQTQCVETWMPFQTKWDFPDAGKEGKIRTACLLRSVDARSTSARKLMIRAGIGVCCEAAIPCGVRMAVPEDFPSDVFVLKKTYPVMFPAETGEKMFTLDEELTLPASCPEIDRLIRYELRPELVDQKVIANKAVFRGAVIVHILYCTEGGELHNWEFEVPFSQYAELDGEYTENAQASFWFAVTNLELEKEVDGGLGLKAGLTGQYTVYDRTNVEVAEDAYSVAKKVKLLTSQLQMPSVLDIQQKTVAFKATPQLDCKQIADICWCPDQPEVIRRSDEIDANLSGILQLLYYDSTGALQSYTEKVDGSCVFAADQNVDPVITICPSGKPMATLTQTGPELHMDARMESRFDAEFSIEGIEGMELTDLTEKDENAPGLILRRAGGDSLWSIAKQAGSSIDAIMEANRLQGEPDDNRMLLIPLLSNREVK